MRSSGLLILSGEKKTQRKRSEEHGLETEYGTRQMERNFGGRNCEHYCPLSCQNTLLKSHFISRFAFPSCGSFKWVVEQLFLCVQRDELVASGPDLLWLNAAPVDEKYSENKFQGLVTGTRFIKIARAQFVMAAPHTALCNWEKT